MSAGSRVFIVVLILAAGGGGYWLWKSRPVPKPPAPPQVARPVQPAELVPLPPPAEPAVKHPIEAAKSGARGPLPAIDDSDDYFKKALDELVGKKSGLSFLVLSEFARRAVATVNNLATDNSASELWPVARTPGSFAADARGGGSVISDRNGDRYEPFVRFIEGIDTGRAIALYVRVYPLLQRAYEDLGYPGKYFNDRLVEVIEHLLATPELAGPIRVKRVAADGISKPSARGGLYLYEDAALEGSSSGQKILLRVGPANAAKLKAKLTEVRRRLVKGSVARSAP